MLEEVFLFGQGEGSATLLKPVVRATRGPNPCCNGEQYTVLGMTESPRVFLRCQVLLLKLQC